MTPTLGPNNALQALNLLNPLAAPVYGGLEGPDGSVDFTYPYDTELVGGVPFTDVIKTNTDADFHYTAPVINSYTSIQFAFRLSINGIYYLSDNLILAANLAGDPSAPPPVLGRFVIPRGADLKIEFQELSGADNTIEILFRGMKLYGSGSRASATASAAPTYGLGRLGGRRW